MYQSTCGHGVLRQNYFPANTIVPARCAEATRMTRSVPPPMFMAACRRLGRAAARGPGHRLEGAGAPVPTLSAVDRTRQAREPDGGGHRPRDGGLRLGDRAPAAAGRVTGPSALTAPRNLGLGDDASRFGAGGARTSSRAYLRIPLGTPRRPPAVPARSRARVDRTRIRRQTAATQGGRQDVNHDLESSAAARPRYRRNLRSRYEATTLVSRAKQAPRRTPVRW
jgi:hypothetical protein